MPAPEHDAGRRQAFLAAAPGAGPAGARASQWAETAFRRVATHGPVSEVEAVPATGRMHQIRATLRDLGFPVVGDKLYGVDPGIFARFCRDEMTDDDRQPPAPRPPGPARRRPAPAASHDGTVAGLRLALPEDMRALIGRLDVDATGR